MISPSDFIQASFWGDSMRLDTDIKPQKEAPTAPNSDQNETEVGRSHGHLRAVLLAVNGQFHGHLRAVFHGR